MQDLAQSPQIGQQITQIILTSSEPQTLLARIAKALGESFQVDGCVIMAGVHPATINRVTLWCADGCPTLSPEQQAQLREHPMLTDKLLSGQLLVIPDIQAFDTWSVVAGSGKLLPVRAVLRIGTWFQGSVNGVIVLARAHPYEWTQLEQELLVSVSETVAIAISQVQLTLQRLAATRHQTLLNHLSLASNSTLSLDEILQMAIAVTAQTFQVSRGLILLLKYSDPLFPSPASKRLPITKVTVAYEWLEETTPQSAKDPKPDNTLLNQSFLLSESSLCQQAFQDAPESMVITNGRGTTTVVAPKGRISIFDWEIMPAMLMIPLVTNQNPAAIRPTVWGFLVLQHCHPRPWYTDELELGKWVSTQISATMIHHQTLRQVQSLVEERTAQLKNSLEVQAKLYEKTRQQIDQLQQLNQLQEEFMSTMSHELRTPLTKMSLAIKMLRQPQLAIERREKYLEILEQECNQEIDLINDLLSLQGLESKPSHIQPQKIDLMLLLKDLAQSFERKWADKRLTLTVESPGGDVLGGSTWRKRRLPVNENVAVETPGGFSPQVPTEALAPSLMLYTDPNSLNRILLELLTNAGKYSDPDTTVDLKIAHQVQQSVNQVVITLSNTGPGISPTDLSYIFEKFRRGQGVTQQAVQGTGLGLALVKCLVQHLNGTIEVSSCPGENSQTFLTSFTLTLPQFH